MTAVRRAACSPAARRRPRGVLWLLPERVIGGDARAVVVLDYGSGNLRSAERALARAGADVTVTADLTAAAAADGLVVPGVGAYAACMAGIEALGRRPGDRRAGRRRPAGARHLRRHAGALRARRRARRGDQGPGAAARRGDPAGRRAAAAHGLEHGRRRRPVRCSSPGCPPTAGSTSCTPTRCATRRRWPRRAPRSPPPTTARTSSPRSSGVRCRPPSSTRRSPADAGAALLRNWLATLTASPSAARRPDRVGCAVSKERARRRAVREAEAGPGPRRTAAPSWPGGSVAARWSAG